MNVQIMLILVVGFLAGMIPAMLLIGFFGGRQVEKQRKELKLQYERQVTALRATIRRLMQRIDLLSDERKQLKSSNQNLQEALRDQHRYADDASAELLQLKQEVEKLTAENLRHEGRLQEAHVQQEQRELQFAQTVAQFAETDRLRRHLLFATNQLRSLQNSNQGTVSSSADSLSTTQFLDLSDISAAKLDVGVIESIDTLYVERLHESGVHTVADLARQTPARVAHFTGLSSWDESTQWIEEAKALMTPPPSSGA